MKYFFDESGSFALKNPGTHIMVGIVYPDVFEKRLRIFYDRFVSSLISEEFENSEPKGRLLLSESREKLFSFLHDHSWLRISVSLTDSQFNSEYQINQYRTEQLHMYQKQLLDPIFRSQPKAFKILQDKLINDFKIKGGLSNVQIVKGLLLMHTLVSLLKGSLEYYTQEVYDDDWEHFFICFDRQDKNIITRMEDWIDRNFQNVITVYTSKKPIEFNDGWFLRNHPILKKFRDANDYSLNLNQIFKDKFLFEFSDKCFQLQIVDWISNSLFNVFKKELPRKFLNMIEDNLIKYNDANIIVVKFECTDSQSLYNKYKDFLH